MQVATTSHEHVLTALRVSTLHVDSANLLYGRERGKQEVDVPVWCGLIKANDTWILVDTGVRDPAWVAANDLGACYQGEDDTMVGALAHVGLRPEDIGIVVNSHLHFDHCANNLLFPQAQLIVSQNEWEAAQNPVENQAILYSRREWLFDPLAEDSYTLIDQDVYEILPGVRVVTTPGHTPGHQVVMVDTSEGTVCVAGDSVNINENFVAGKPGGIVWDLDRSIESLERIRHDSDRILMAHDNRVVDFMDHSFPTIPPHATAGVCC